MTNQILQGLSRLGLAAIVFAASRTGRALANPTGLSVGLGSATAQQLGSQLNVTVGQTAILNWSTFNIGAGETTSFLQPSANSVTFNLIGDRNPSQIFGNLNARGTVILANANGFYFGPDSLIKVGGSFIATTAPLAPDFGTGGMWLFTGMPPLANIINYGQIEVGTGKSLYLIAEKIENHGSLAAPQGDIGLLAGDTVLVSERPDGRGLSATTLLPQGSVDNFGRVTADAGTIALSAKVVNQDGILQADSIAQKNGAIELVAADTVNLGADSQLLARGDDSAGGSPGGMVTLKADNIFSDRTGGQMVTTGGAHGGNGGNIEVSAPNIQSLDSAMNASAQTGFSGGEFLLDPINISLNSSGSTTTVPDGGGTLNGSANSSATWNVNVNTAFKNKSFAQILLEASGNISVSAGLNWDLSASTGLTAGQLTLLAGGDITFGNNSKLTDANAWSIALESGYNFGRNIVNSGSGNVYLNGGSGQSLNGTIQLGSGAVSLLAGQSIWLGSGSVTTSGGNVSGQAGGDITFGSGSGISTTGPGGVNLAAGYNFAGSVVQPGLGNIYLNGGSSGTSSANIQTSAGSVNLVAGQNVLLASQASHKNQIASGSVFTTGGGSIFVDAIAGNLDAGTANGGINPGSQSGDYRFLASGAVLNPVLGGIATAAGGNVTLIAGKNVDSSPVFQSKQFNAASGAFGGGDVNVIAGNQINGNFLLANGNGTMLAGAQVTSAQAAILQNPAANAVAYAAVLGDLASAVKQAGGTKGNIGGPEYSGASSSAVSLSLIQGSWNVFAADNLLLKEVNNPNGTFNSANSFLYNYGADASANFWAGNAIELAGGTTGGTLPRSGANKNIVYAPRLSLNAGAGGIKVDNAIILAPSLEGSLNLVTRNGGNLTGPASGTLGGITMSDSDSTDYRTFSTGHAAAPLHINDSSPVTVSVAGSIDNFNLVVPTFARISVAGDAYDFGFSGRNLSVSQTTSISVGGSISYQPFSIDNPNNLLGNLGLNLKGPGNFNISAASMDLGVSEGISVAELDPADAGDAGLAAISPYGANLTVATTGDLSMTSTKISNESYRGGVTLNVGGVLNVGNEYSIYGDVTSSKGIFTVSGGDVSVHAHGDVNVNGSRIAAYDGGNISVVSETGDVNAGTGDSGLDIYVYPQQLDPATGKLAGSQNDSTDAHEIQLSGILALTLYGTEANLGNITINTPQGSVNASQGGMMQIALNTADTKNNFIQIDAAKDINANHSGIIGSNVRLQAGGNISGVIVGSSSVNIAARQNVDATAVSGGNVNIAASGTVSGTIVGGGEVSVSGDFIDAAIRGSSVSAAGNTSGASIGVPASNVAKETTQTADGANTVAGKTDATEGDGLNKKKKGIALAQKVSRVTVLLPQTK
ncbi:MAG: filamentous hemagglutinin N-terminal domain-containing protein [Verrucomicrobiota bacterium]